MLPGQEESQTLKKKKRINSGIYIKHNTIHSPTSQLLFLIPVPFSAVPCDHRLECPNSDAFWGTLLVITLHVDCLSCANMRLGKSKNQNETPTHLKFNLMLSYKSFESSPCLRLPAHSPTDILELHQEGR